MRRPIAAVLRLPVVWGSNFIHAEGAKDMPGKFEDAVRINIAPFAGDYEYNSQSDKNLLTYYKGGRKDTDDIHFSVPGTDGGQTPLRRFHITKSFAGKNFHIKYYLLRGTATFDGDNRTELPTREQAQAVAFLVTNRLGLDQAAQQFAARLPKQGNAVASVFAADEEMPRAAILAGTPILSQANAVGQGFDIYGEFDTESLIRPLVDSSRAPTQVFTFLGKDYLIPAYVTAVESTSGYFNVAAGANRDGIQNSIATHAGVEGSYGAFTGEMKADFTGEFKENAAFSFGFIDFYSALATLQLNTSEYLTADFLRAVAALPDTATVDNLPAFVDFFTRYGIYYTQRVTLGGSLGFNSALSKRDGLTKAEFEFLLKAQYKALFSSGKLDAGVKASAEWKSYSESSQASARVQGGSPKAAAALAAVDPLGFSPATVSAYTAWVDSVGSDPAIVDFALQGIWNLAGDKSTVVQAAWELFGQTMRPRLVMQTSTGNTPWPTPPAQPPVVTIGELVRPPARPAGPAGYQLIVLDGTDVSGPGGVLLNRYFCIPLQQNWSNTYESVYEEMLTALQAPGLAQPGNVIVLVSFGLDKAMTPTNDFYALLQSAGAGPLLRRWVETADPGSQIANSSVWVGSPVNYTLVGLFGSGPDSGVEGYNAAEWMVPASLRSEALFYRTSVTGQYTLGGGS